MVNDKSDRVPRYRLHKATGQAVVTLNGRDHYLGKHKTKASKTAYERLIAEWLAAGRQMPADSTTLSVNEALVQYWRFATQHYRKLDGTPTTEQSIIKTALRPLKRLYGSTQAAKFGPLALQTVRQQFIEAGISRGVTNAYTNRIKRVFRWAVEKELVPPSVDHGLRAVAGLKRGRSDAHETEPVRPVPEAFVDAVLPHVPAAVAAMIDVQRLTACRPGEVCAMRACDIDMSGRIWIYRPADHKTAWRGREKEIYIGPKAQEIIRPFLKPDLQAYLFAPRDKEASGTGRWSKKACYGNISYWRVIHDACIVGGVPPWSPNRLRHNAATRLRKEYGIELTRIILGHALLNTAQIYAEADRTQAIEVIAKIG